MLRTSTPTGEWIDRAVTELELTGAALRIIASQLRNPAAMGIATACPQCVATAVRLDALADNIDKATAPF